MRAILITSTAPYSGKSGLSLALIATLADRGLDVGYFKPYGAMPVTVDGVLTDQDALYINRVLARPAPMEAVCPIVRTQALIESALAHREGDVRAAALEAYGVCSHGRDVMVIEGPSDPFQASSLGLAAPDLAIMLDARVLLLDRLKGNDLPDAAVCEARRLGELLRGVIFNWVHESQTEFVTGRVMPYLRSRGIPILGAIPHDMALSTVTVREIVDALNGAVLSADDRLDEPVETFMVGAMGQDKALRFFRRKARKAVITGGDRADVQLAALETNTRCIILTGNMLPSSVVLSRAEELGVPIVLVDTDTLTAVEKMERLMGRTRLHDATKAARIREMFERSVDVDALMNAFEIRS
ncbi:MAG: phosphotransacetylase family protein [Actinomycetia bacterium]|nr:phosphotransacetylase family protein [Actinomycetes bacterium]